jgi:hypothetical protein
LVIAHKARRRRIGLSAFVQELRPGEWHVGALGIGDSHARVEGPWFDLPCLDGSGRLSRLSLRLAPILPAIAVESTRLPWPFHRDPVDRLLTAAARVDGLTLPTR